MATIVYDDSNSGLLQGGGEWDSGIFGHDELYFDGGFLWRNDTKSLSDTDPNKYGTLSMTFEGTSIAFVGLTDMGNTEPITVSIDGAPYNTTIQLSGTDLTFHQWFQSPKLEDGTHSINISAITGEIGLDYMLVTAGQNTTLSSERLIVDDNDPAITYQGMWKRQQTPIFVMNDIAIDRIYRARPYQNDTHQTSTPGAQATFLFKGTQVSVYSVYDYWAPCGYNASFIIDGSLHPVSRYNPTNSWFKKAGTIGHTSLWQSDKLPMAAVHNLTIRLEAILGCEPETAESYGYGLSLDYFIYTPSFETLAEAGLPLTAPNPSSTAKRSNWVFPVIGGLVACLIVAAIIVLLVYRRRRTQHRTRRYAPIWRYAFLRSQRGSLDEMSPFTLASPTTPHATPTTGVSSPPVTQPLLSLHKPPLHSPDSASTASTGAPGLSPGIEQSYSNLGDSAASPPPYRSEVSTQ